YYLLGIPCRYCLKVLQLGFAQRRPPLHCRIDNLNHFAVLDDEFRFTFTSLTLAMDVNGLMLVRVEQYDDSEIFIEFRHLQRYFANRPTVRQDAARLCMVNARLQLLPEASLPKRAIVEDWAVQIVSPKIAGCVHRAYAPFIVCVCVPQTDPGLFLPKIG